MTQEGQSLGTARIDVVVDTSSWDAAISAGNSRLQSMSATAQQAYAQMSAAQKRQTDSLLKQADTIGFNKDQMILYNAAVKGMPTAVIDDLKSKLLAAKQASLDAASALKTTGDSLKSVTFSDAQMFKVNQALAQFKASAADAASAAATIKAPPLSDTQIFKANQALSSYKTALQEASIAQQAAADAAASDDARYKAVAQAAIQRAEAEQQAAAAVRAATQLTAEERAEVDRLRASFSGQANQAKAAAGATAEEKAALDVLLDKIYPTQKALRDLEAQEAQLAKAWKSGQLSATQYRDAVAEIGSKKDALDGVGKNAEDAAGHMARLSFNTSGARHEVGYLISEALQGNWGAFEGSLATLANRTGLLTSALSLTGLGVAAVAGELVLFGKAALDAYEDEQRVNQAIALTGNYAGVTAGSINQLAAGIGQSTARVGEARDILTALAASGKVSGDSLQALGRAALQMAELTGQSADEATKSATALFDGTAAGAAKANEQYHFLNDAQYEQIRALEQQGKAQEAVRVEAEAFSDSVGPRLDTMKSQVYGLASAWDSAKASTRSWWEEFKTGASVLAGTADQLTQYYALLGKKQSAQSGGANSLGTILGAFVNTDAENMTAAFGPLGPLVTAGTKQTFSAEDQKKLDALKASIDASNASAQDQATSAGLNSDAISGDSTIDRLSASIDKASGKKQALAELSAAFDKLWGSADPNNARLAGVQRIVADDGSVSFAGGLYDKLAADINTKYANKGLPAPDVQSYKDALSAAATAFSAYQKNLDSGYKAGEITSAAYYAAMKDSVQTGAATQVAEINAEIAALQRYRGSQQQNAEAQKQISALQTQAANVQAEAQGKLHDLDNQQIQDSKKKELAFKTLTVALQAKLKAEDDDIANQVASVSMGSQEYERQQKLIDINKQRATELDKLAHDDVGLDPAVYQANVDQINGIYDQMVAHQIMGYAQIDAARASWQNGAKQGWANFKVEATDVASSTAGAVGNAFNSFTDDMMTFLNTGKLSFKSFATSVLEDIEKIALKLAEEKAVSAIIGKFLPGGGSGTDYLSDNTAISTNSGGLAAYGASANAKGGVYSSPSLSAYSGNVYDSPQFFKFAKGAGVFAEAGPEAIMPLARGADGKLGVKSSGGSSGDTHVSVNVNIASDGSSQVSASGDAQAFAKSMGDQMAAVAQREIAKAKKPGGQLYAPAGR